MRQPATILGATLLIAGAACLSPCLAQTQSDYVRAQDAAGQLEMLSQRGAKHYLMYQYHIGELAASKAPLVATAEQFDDLLAGLRSSGRGAAYPLTPELAQQLDTIDKQWSVLRKIYTYQPVNLWRDEELVPPEVRSQDPVLVRYVNRLSGELLSEVEVLVRLYRSECREAGHAQCGAVIDPTVRQRMLVEAMTKEILFGLLRMYPKDRRDTLRAHRDEFEATLPRMTGADTGSGSVSPRQVTTAQTIEAYWRQLEVFVDLALDGDEDDIEVNHLLRTGSELLEEIDSLVALQLEAS